MPHASTRKTLFQVALADIKLFCLGSQLLTAAGGIRRSLDFPEFTSVNPGSHQGTSILVTNPKINDWPGACFPIVFLIVSSLISISIME